MKKYYFNCALLLIVLSNPLQCQNNMTTDAHKLICSLFQNVPENYLIFNINPNNGSNTNGNVIYQIYTEIKKRYSHLSIYFIIDKDGISDKNVGQYFEEVLKIPFDIAKNNIKISKDLYKTFSHGNLLSNLIYVYNGDVFYDWPFKFSPPENLNFPENLVKVQYTKKVQINSNKYLNTNLNQFYPFKNKVLQLADANGRISILNPETGNIEFVFDPSQLNPIDVFKKYISQDKEKITSAEKSEKWFKENNRFQMPIYNASIDGDNIYIVFGMQYLQTSENNKKFGNIVVSAGTEYAENYLFLMKCDSTLKIKNLWQIKDQKGEVGDLIYPIPDTKFYVSDDLLFCYNSSEDQIGVDEKEKKSQWYNKGITRFKIPKDNSKELIFDGVAQAPFVKNYELKAEIELYGDIFLWNNNLYNIYTTSPFIYNLKNANPINKLLGRGAGFPEQKEYYKKSLVDTIQNFINWEFITSSAILNNQYYAFIYKYQGVPLLELKDKDLVTKQIINLQFIPQLSNIEFINWNCFLIGDYFYLWVFENDDFYLYQYQITAR